MKTLVGRKAWLEENRNILLTLLWVTCVILWPHHFLKPAGNISLQASAHSAVSSWCQTRCFLQHLSQALPVSHCHRDSVCLLETTAEMCSLETRDGWRRQTTSRPVGVRCWGEDFVAKSWTASLFQYRKATGFRNPSAGKATSWSATEKLRKPIPMLWELYLNHVLLRDY